MNGISIGYVGTAVSVLNSGKAALLLADRGCRFGCFLEIGLVGSFCDHRLRRFFVFVVVCASM